MIIDSHFGNVNLIFLIGHFHAGRKLPIEDRRLESLRLCRFKIYSLRSIRKSGWLFLFGWEFFRVRIAEINSASVKKPLLRFDHFLWFDSFSSTSFCQNCKEIFHRRTTECFLSFSFVFFFGENKSSRYCVQWIWGKSLTFQFGSKTSAPFSRIMCFIYIFVSIKIYCLF